jgi:thiol-disulfide isomerase/thioredoxin
MNAPAKEDAAHAAPMSPPRRRWLYGAVAGIAAAAGAGLAWRNGHVVQTTPGSAPPDGLWGLSFQTPQGSTLRMDSFKGKPLLLNFWATWCPPCVEEMPLLDRFFAENSANGWQVLGLAVDQAEPVKRFLQARPVGFAIALAGLAGTDLSRTLGNSAGGLPFSVAFDSAGRIVQRKMGQLGAQDLQQWRAAP